MPSYVQFISVHSFPIPFKEFNSLTRAISNGLIQLVKSHLSHGENNITAITDVGWNLTNRYKV